MFRAQQNAFDDVVVKATDENLTSENWEYILDVCDKVATEDSGAKDAVAAMIKRLAHRNANVQLYTLELANALSQNCGIKMHKELASRSFTDALLRLAADRNTHQQVKAKILERMADWAEMFTKDPDLGIMEQAYMKLKTQNPNLRPPSKPIKAQITDADRLKEEEELQMALALSIKEKEAARPNRSQGASSSTTAASQSQHQPVPSGTTAATVSRVRALYDFTPTEPGELAFRKGDIIAVLESVYKDWWKGSLRSQTGIFPLNYVEKLQDPTREELEREAQMEAEVFAEIRNVEKLLALLSTSSRTTDDVRDNEEITTLYHQTLAIRPKLIELIGKYSQKKDDFTQLNEKFIKARRDYEALLEASMSQPVQPAYGRPAYSYGSGYPPTSPPPQEQRYYGTPGASGPAYPPQSGPQPFYMIPTSEAQQPDRTSPKPSGTAYASQQIHSGQGRPTSTIYPPGAGGAPQELATGRFDSPVENRANFVPPTSQPAPQIHSGTPHDSYPPPAQQPHPTSSYLPNRQPSYDSTYGAPPSSQQPASDPYATEPPQSGHNPNTYQQRPPLQPSHPPPGVPNSPPLGASPYAGYPGQQPAAPGGYQAYQPPQQQRWPSGGAPPGDAATRGEDGEGFYR